MTSLIGTFWKSYITTNIFTHLLLQTKTTNTAAMTTTHAAAARPAIRPATTTTQ